MTVHEQSNAKTHARQKSGAKATVQEQGDGAPEIPTQSGGLEWHERAQHASIDLATAPASIVQAPVVVAPGGTIGVGGAGFIPNEPVVFWYNLPNATAAPLYVLDGQLVLSKPPTDDWWRRWQDRHPKDRRNARDGNDWRNRYQQDTTTLNANASGQISTIFWDTGLAAGTYSIVAHGLTSGVNDVVIFTVT